MQSEEKSLPSVKQEEEDEGEQDVSDCIEDLMHWDALTAEVPVSVEVEGAMPPGAEENTCILPDLDLPENFPVTVKEEVEELEKVGETEGGEEEEEEGGGRRGGNTGGRNVPARDTLRLVSIDKLLPENATRWSACDPLAADVPGYPHGPGKQILHGRRDQNDSEQTAFDPLAADVPSNRHDPGEQLPHGSRDQEDYQVLASRHLFLPLLEGMSSGSCPLAVAEKVYFPVKHNEYTTEWNLEIILGTVAAVNPFEDRERWAVIEGKVRVFSGIPLERWLIRSLVDHLCDRWAHRHEKNMSSCCHLPKQGKVIDLLREVSNLREEARRNPPKPASKDTSYPTVPKPRFRIKFAKPKVSTTVYFPTTPTTTITTSTSVSSTSQLSTSLASSSGRAALAPTAHSSRQPSSSTSGENKRPATALTTEAVLPQKSSAHKTAPQPSAAQVSQPSLPPAISSGIAAVASTAHDSLQPSSTPPSIRGQLTAPLAEGGLAQKPSSAPPAKVGLAQKPSSAPPAEAGLAQKPSSAPPAKVGLAQKPSSAPKTTRRRRAAPAARATPATQAAPAPQVTPNRLLLFPKPSSALIPDARQSQHAKILLPASSSPATPAFTMTREGLLVVVSDPAQPNQRATCIIPHDILTAATRSLPLNAAQAVQASAPQSLIIPNSMSSVVPLSANTSRNTDVVFPLQTSNAAFLPASTPTMVYSNGSILSTSSFMPAVMPVSSGVAEPSQSVRPVANPTQSRARYRPIPVTSRRMEHQKALASGPDTSFVPNILHSEMSATVSSGVATPTPLLQPSLSMPSLSPISLSVSGNETGGPSQSLQISAPSLIPTFSSDVVKEKVTSNVTSQPLPVKGVSAVAEGSLSSALPVSSSCAVIDITDPALTVGESSQMVLNSALPHSVLSSTPTQAAHSVSSESSSKAQRILTSSNSEIFPRDVTAQLSDVEGNISKRQTEGSSVTILERAFQGPASAVSVSNDTGTVASSATLPSLSSHAPQAVSSSSSSQKIAQRSTNTRVRPPNPAVKDLYLLKTTPVSKTASMSTAMASPTITTFSQHSVPSCCVSGTSSSITILNSQMVEVKKVFSTPVNQMLPMKKILPKRSLSRLNSPLSSTATAAAMHGGSAYSNILPKETAVTTASSLVSSATNVTSATEEMPAGTQVLASVTSTSTSLNASRTAAIPRSESEASEVAYNLRSRRRASTSSMDNEKEVGSGAGPAPKMRKSTPPVPASDDVPKKNTYSLRRRTPGIASAPFPRVVLEDIKYNKSYAALLSRLQISTTGSAAQKNAPASVSETQHVPGSVCVTQTETSEQNITGNVCATRMASVGISARQILSESVSAAEETSGTLPNEMATSKRVCVTNVASGNLSAPKMASGLVSTEKITSKTVSKTKAVCSPKITLGTVSSVSVSSVSSGSVSASSVRLQSCPSSHSVNPLTEVLATATAAQNTPGPGPKSLPLTSTPHRLAAPRDKPKLYSESAGQSATGTLARSQLVAGSVCSSAPQTNAVVPAPVLSSQPASASAAESMPETLQITVPSGTLQNVQSSYSASATPSVETLTFMGTPEAVVKPYPATPVPSTTSASAVAQGVPGTCVPLSCASQSVPFSITPLQNGSTEMSLPPVLPQFGSVPGTQQIVYVLPTAQGAPTAFPLAPQIVSSSGLLYAPQTLPAVPLDSSQNIHFAYSLTPLQTALEAVPQSVISVNTPKVVYSVQNFQAATCIPPPPHLQQPLPTASSITIPHSTSSPVVSHAAIQRPLLPKRDALTLLQYVNTDVTLSSSETPQPPPTFTLSHSQPAVVPTPRLFMNPRVQPQNCVPVSNTIVISPTTHGVSDFPQSTLHVQPASPIVVAGGVTDPSAPPVYSYAPVSSQPLTSSATVQTMVVAGASSLVSNNGSSDTSASLQQNSLPSAVCSIPQLCVSSASSPSCESVSELPPSVVKWEDIRKVSKRTLRKGHSKFERLLSESVEDKVRVELEKEKLCVDFLGQRVQERLNRIKTLEEIRKEDFK